MSEKKADLYPQEGSTDNVAGSSQLSAQRVEENQVNSKYYWDARFERDWSEMGGPSQSRFFYDILVDNLPSWLRKLIQKQKPTICDWGCATGEGTEFVARHFNVSVHGVDFSTSAIMTAERRFDKAKFICENWLDENFGSPKIHYDLLMTSNTLEHFEQPWIILNKISDFAKNIIIIQVPFREYERHHEHEATFDFDNIPLEVNQRFYLVGYKLINTSVFVPTFWPGEQIILFYASPSVITQENLRLIDFFGDNQFVDSPGVDESMTASAQIGLKKNSVPSSSAKRLRDDFRKTLYHELNRSYELAIEVESEKTKLKLARYLLRKQEEDLLRFRHRLIINSRGLGNVADNLQTPDIFIWAIIDWDFRIQRPQHLAQNFAKCGYRTFYISNVFEETEAPGFKIKRLDEEGLLNLVNLNLADPPSIYAGQAVAATSDFLAKSLGRLIEFTKSTAIYNIVQHPFWTNFASLLPNNKLIYDMMDHHEGFEDGAEDLIKLEKSLIERSDLVIVTSDYLFDIAKDRNDKVEVIRNAGDFGHFGKRPPDQYSPQLELSTTKSEDSEGKDLKSKDDFDVEWYYKRYPDVAISELSAADHYEKYGLAEGRFPNAWHENWRKMTDSIDPIWYLNRYGDVKSSGVDPTFHFHHYGYIEGRHPNALYEELEALTNSVDQDWYLRRYPDVLAGGVDPASHFRQHGYIEGRHPNALYEELEALTNSVDQDWYLRRYPDVLASGVDPASHFRQYGFNEGRSPYRTAEEESTFIDAVDTAWYFRRYADRSRRKVIGYYGAIALWFDRQLIRVIAEAFPDHIVLLIGADSIGAQKELSDLVNVSFTGEVAYSVLPSYLYCFDVCILPFKILPLTLATNPVKVYEYLSAGLPVVSVDLPELKHFDGLVSIASNYDEFVQHLTRLLATPPRLQDVKRRRKFAVNQTWEQRAQLALEYIEKAQRPKVSIVIVTYNNIDLTERCLRSVALNTFYDNYEIIVVDNASQDGTDFYLKEWALLGRNRRFVLNDSNLGFSAANNIGLRQATGDYIVLLNNDVYVTPGWLGTLVGYLGKNNGVGMVGPVTNRIGNEAKINIEYNNMEEMEEKARSYTAARLGQYFKIRTLAFYCVSFTRALFEKVGELDENYGIGMFEDDDYCRRVESNGFDLLCVEDVFVHHEHMSSFKQMETDIREKLFQTNRDYYESKWGKWVPHTYRPD